MLEGILGVPVRGRTRATPADAAPGAGAAMPDLEDADGVEFGGLGLEEFLSAANAEEKQMKGRRRIYSEQSIDECKHPSLGNRQRGVLTWNSDEREKDKFQDLHRSIKACDEVLNSVESYLSAFQTDLGTVSGEIESLQNRSMSLSQQLGNRKAVEKLLGPIVDDIVIPPNDVRRLVEGDVNDTWVQALHETDRRMKAIQAQDPEKVKAVKEVQPELEKLTHKVRPYRERVIDSRFPLHDVSGSKTDCNRLSNGCATFLCRGSRRCGCPVPMPRLSSNRASCDTRSCFNLWPTTMCSSPRRLPKLIQTPCAGII